MRDNNVRVITVQDCWNEGFSISQCVFVTGTDRDTVTRIYNNLDNAAWTEAMGYVGKDVE